MLKSHLLVMALLIVFFTGTQSASAQIVHVPDAAWLTDWWSWMFWWEANREEFLTGPHREDEYVPEQRTEAVAALLAALDDNSPPEVVAAAALALGRINEPRAVERLVELTKHANDSVRRSAWMALGLIGNDVARKHIEGVLAAPNLEEHDTLAWIVSVGLMTEPSDELLKAMHKLLQHDRSADVSRMAMWALRVHHPPGIEELAREVVAKTIDPELCNEAALVLGIDPTEHDAQLLIRMYHSRLEERNVPVSLRTVSSEYGGARSKFGPYIAGLRNTSGVAFANAVRSNDRARLLIRRTLLRSYAKVDAAPDRFRLDRPWGQGWGSMEDGSFELRFGLIACGRSGDEEVAELLLQVVRKQHTSWRVGGEKELDPSRGFAALGLGLYLRNAHNETRRPNNAVRRQRRLAADALARIAADRGEPADLRAACVLAMGMTNNRELSGAIRTAATSLEGGDRLVSAYAVLALGMLRDESSLILAKKMLPKPGELTADAVRQRAFGEKTPVDEAILRRAVVLGLACLGQKQGVALLNGMYGRDSDSSMEMIRTLKWCNDYSITPILIELLENPGDNIQVAVISAWSLGELYDPNEDPRLHAAILKDCNLALPVTSGSVADRIEQSSIYRYRCYTNEFLFKAMIPVSAGPRR